jgi:hypothetical protein
VGLRLCANLPATRWNVSSGRGGETLVLRGVREAVEPRRGPYAARMRGRTGHDADTNWARAPLLAPPSGTVRKVHVAPPTRGARQVNVLSNRASARARRRRRRRVGYSQGWTSKPIEEVTRQQRETSVPRRRPRPPHEAAGTQWRAREGLAATRLGRRETPVGLAGISPVRGLIPGTGGRLAATFVRASDACTAANKASLAM